MQHTHAVEHNHGSYCQKHKQNNAGSNAASCGNVAFGNSRNIVGAINFAHVAVGVFSIELYPAKRAVLQVAFLETAGKRIGSFQRFVGVVANGVIGGRNGKHVAILANGYVFKNRFK